MRLALRYCCGGQFIANLQCSRPQVAKRGGEAWGACLGQSSLKGGPRRGHRLGRARRGREGHPKKAKRGVFCEIVITSGCHQKTQADTSSKLCNTSIHPPHRPVHNLVDMIATNAIHHQDFQDQRDTEILVFVITPLTDHQNCLSILVFWLFFLFLWSWNSYSSCNFFIIFFFPGRYPTFPLFLCYPPSMYKSCEPIHQPLICHLSCHKFRFLLLVGPFSEALSNNKK